MGEIKRFLRDDGPIKISRSLKELGVKIEVAKKEYLGKTGEDISLKELSKELGVSKEEIAMALDSCRTLESIDEQIYEEDGENKLSRINITQKDETSKLIDKICLERVNKELRKQR